MTTPATRERIDVVYTDGHVAPWRWVHRYQAGKLDGYSRERFTNALDAAYTALRVAACKGIPVTDYVAGLIVNHGAWDIGVLDASCNRPFAPERHFSDERKHIGYAYGYAECKPQCRIAADYIDMIELNHDETMQHANDLRAMTQEM
jgi:hypothetical protein